MGEAAAEAAQAQFSNMEAAMRQQLSQFRANASSEGTLTDDVMGFYHAVDWSEPWLKGLLAFHVTVWVLAIATRKLNDVQIVMLLSILALVYFAETINRVAGENWESFAGQQYFDKRGVFVSVVLSTPLLFASFFILINALRGAATLLIQVKKMEFKEDAKKKSKAAKAGKKGQ